jgi:hypothetical protein
LIEAANEHRPHDKHLYFAVQRVAAEIKPTPKSAVVLSSVRIMAAKLAGLAEIHDTIEFDRLPFWQLIATTFGSLLIALENGDLSLAEELLGVLEETLERRNSVN